MFVAGGKSRNVRISHLSSTFIAPRALSAKAGRRSAAVASLQWIEPGTPCDSMRLAD
jgi:hypothetical protein